MAGRRPLHIVKKRPSAAAPYSAKALCAATPARALLLFCLCSFCVFAQHDSSWRVARSGRFEVCAQAGEASARAALLWFERLHALVVQQTGLKLEGLPPLRVIGFRSPAEYEPYRIGPAADAYYVGTEGRDYIVMSSLAASAFPTAVHEYAHALLHGSGYRLPPWLAEGLADVFSTVRIGERASTIGGDLPARSQELRRGRWIPLASLLEQPSDSVMFYAESWALADMLAFAPEYAPRFSKLVAKLAGGEPGPGVLAQVYGRPLDAVERDLRAWSVRRRTGPLALAGVPPGATPAGVFELSPYELRAMSAELLMVAGKLDRAETSYRKLADEAPYDGGIRAALGTIALRQGDRERARREWKRAIQLGVKDASLCYRYAALASMAGIPEAEIRPALETAVALNPDFDDARYLLAIAEKNTGDYEQALRNFRAMRNVAPARAFAWWSAVADTLNQLDRREEAKAAAAEAARHAATAEERARAATLGYVAATDLTIRMAHAEDGSVHMVATRIPHGLADWNPFVEAGDHVRRVSGTLREIDCAGAVTRFLLETQSGPLALAIPDPSKMQVRNRPGEFTCGVQDPAAHVSVVYAAKPVAGVKADGVLRGVEF
jgi:tetratricopeptide (TPR) repeat protein